MTNPVRIETGYPRVKMYQRSHQWNRTVMAPRGLLQPRPSYSCPWANEACLWVAQTLGDSPIYDIPIYVYQAGYGSRLITDDVRIENSYPAGENAVAERGGIPPDEETQQPVQEVVPLYREYTNDSCQQRTDAPGVVTVIRGTIVSCSEPPARQAGHYEERTTQ